MKDARFNIKMRSLLIVVLTLVIGFSANAQKKSVTGVVRDAAGETVIGASVLEKGTTNGMMTNFDGQFALEVAPNATLVISYIGYKTQELSVAGQTNFFITMEEDAQLLQEVVAIGYGTVKKNDATGSVTAIKPEEMNKGLTTNAQDMITGKIAGVNVTSGGGTPGGGATIRIRGGSSLNASNDPLIVVDGLALDNNSVKGLSNGLNTINPNDIETFTVLKDASATAIYGSRASNGVIIITTKKGKKGSKPSLAYNGNFSVGAIGKYLDVMTADEYKKFVNKAYDNNPPMEFGNANTNWQSQIYQTAISHEHNLSLTGGFKNLPYRFSLGYNNQDGIIKTSNFERYTGSFSLNPSLFDNHLNIALNAKGMYVKNRYADGGVVGGAAAMDPTRPVYSDQEPYKTNFAGYWQWLAQGTSDYHIESTKNPVAMLNLKQTTSAGTDIIANADFDYKLHFFPALSAHLTLGYNQLQMEEKLLSEITNAADLGYGRTGWEKTDRIQKLLTSFLKYTTESDVQNFDIMGGYEYQYTRREGDYAYHGVKKLANGDFHNPVEHSWKTHNALVSLFGRANYSLLNRYLLTVTMRADGSSRFAKGHKWGYFPSAALAWKINEESFMENAHSLSDLKLRVGYGITGQQELFSGDFPYLPVYVQNSEGALYPIGNQYMALEKPGAYNPNLKWEETSTYNAGLDFGFLNNRIFGSVDVYYRYTKDLLNMSTASALTNFDVRVLRNIGSMENKGAEFSITGKPVVTNDLTWEVSYNATYNQNKIKELTGAAGQGMVETGGISGGTGGFIQVHAAGFPASSFYVFEQAYDSHGNPIEGLFVDRNDDGIINDNDRYLFQKPSPDWTMGFSTKLIYKQFDFGTSLRASIGNYAYNNYAAGNAQIGSAGFSSLGFYTNIPTSALVTNFGHNREFSNRSDYFVQDASFLRVDNITVGYSFGKIFGGLISSGRLSGTVQNPFLITKYTGIDPEVFGGIDNNIYPRPVMGIVGLSLNF